MENPEENPEEYLENDGIPMEYQAVEGDMPEYQEDEDGDPPASPEQYVSMEPATPPTVHRAIVSASYEFLFCYFTNGQVLYDNLSPDYFKTKR